MSKWQSEAEYIANKENIGNSTLPELQNVWRKLFKKAIVSRPTCCENICIYILSVKGTKPSKRRF